jgi:hypothetical protein
MACLVADSFLLVEGMHELEAEVRYAAWREGSDSLRAENTPLCIQSARQCSRLCWNNVLGMVGSWAQVARSRSYSSDRNMTAQRASRHVLVHKQVPSKHNNEATALVLINTLSDVLNLKGEESEQGKGQAALTGGQCLYLQS